MKPLRPAAQTYLSTVKTNPTVRLIAVFAVLATTMASAQTAPALRPSSLASDEAVVLSPFTVSTDKDVGFVAASSVSGGRTASDLSDTPIAYTVQTQEFLNALNITSLDDAFEWSPNSSKYMDNQQAGVALGVDPMSNSTVRGVASGAPMRNFFNVSYTFDAYNTERFDYMRGPNSVIFGAGTISGSANTQTKQANLNRRLDDIRLRLDSHGGVRFAGDVNAPIGRKAALRLNVVKDDGKTWRDGEIKNKTGAYLAFTMDLAPTTQLRVGAEYARDEIRQMITPLRDNLSGWDGTTYGLQSFTVASATYTPHGVSRIGTSTTSATYILSPDHSAIYNYAGTVQTVGYNTGMRPLNGISPITANLGLSGQPIIDSPFNLPVPAGDLYSIATQNSSFRIPKRTFTNLGAAPIGTNRDKDINLALTQRIGDSLFLELAADANQRNNYGNASYWYSDAVTGFSATYIDINKTTPTGATNPEFLQAYQQAGPDRRFQNSVYAGAHLAIAYGKQWKWVDLNFNTILGLDRDNSWTVREIGVLPINADSRQWGLNNANSFPLYFRQYFDQTPQAAPPIGGAPMTVINPLTGLNTTMTPQWVLSTSRTEGGVTKSWKNLNYGQASLQISLWKKRLILLGAVRQDQQTSIQKSGLRAMSYPVGWNPTNNNYTWRPNAPDNWAALPGSRPLDATGTPLAANLNQSYQNDFNPPNMKTKSTTKSLGGIVRLWGGFSAFGNYGQTFNPGGVGNVTINYVAIAPSTSDSSEVGLRYKLPDGRLSAQITHFSSQTLNDTGGQPTGYSNINPIINTASLSNPNSGTNSRGLGNVPYTWFDTRNLAAHGWEGEVVANFTREWRLTLNVGTTNATQGNLYAMTRSWLSANTPTLIQILQDAGVVITNNVASVPTNANVSPSAATGAAAWNSLQSNAVNWVSGKQLLNRMTKYTANIFTDYTFRSTALKGLRLGAGVQYRGPSVIGFQGSNTIPDPANPTTAAIPDPSHNAYTALWTRSYGIGTVTVAYPLSVGRKKVDLNLTVNNAFNYRHPIYNNFALRPYGANLASPARSVVPIDYTYLEPITLRLSADYKF